MENCWETEKELSETRRKFKQSEKKTSQKQTDPEPDFLIFYRDSIFSKIHFYPNSNLPNSIFPNFFLSKLSIFPSLFYFSSQFFLQTRSFPDSISSKLAYFHANYNAPKKSCVNQNTYEIVFFSKFERNPQTLKLISPQKTEP